MRLGGFDIGNSGTGIKSYDSAARMTTAAGLR
jgi:hypothetical protein